MEAKARRQEAGGIEIARSIISDVEKAFAKNPGFLPDKGEQVLNFG
jgi:hypothetical protein